MSIKFVYALISSDSDFYAEQTLVSMCSLKKHNPDAHVVLVADDATLHSISERRADMNPYVDEVIAVNPPADFSAVQKSRYLKTKLRSAVKGDFLYIDNDTVVISSLTDLENEACEMGAVLDGHRRSREVNQLNDYARITGRRFWNYDKYFNGGLLFVRDTERTHRLFDDWYQIWNDDRERYGTSLDQPSFAQANIKNDYLVQELDGSYNCQIITPEALPIVPKAKILHYFDHAPAGTFFPLRNKKFLRMVKERGINSVISAIIDAPEAFILDESFVLDGKDLAIYNSPMVILGRKLAEDFPWTNKIAQKIYRLFGYRI